MSEISRVYFLAMSYTVGGGMYFYTRLMEYLIEQKNINVGIIDFQDGLFPEYVHKMHPDWDVDHVYIDDFKWKLEDNSVVFCPLEWTCLIHKISGKNIRIATIVWESEIGWKLVFEPKDLKKLAHLVKSNDALCFIDGSLTKVVSKQLKTKFKDIVLPLYAKTHVEPFTHTQINPDEINLVWLGRLCPTKIMALENIVQNFAFYKTDKKKRLHIIGDGNAAAALKKFCRQFSDIEFIFCGVMTGEKLEEYLQTKTDVAVAMGTSCINCADLGLPAIWAHEWPTPYFCNQFVWAKDQSDYMLSSSFPRKYRNGKEQAFSKMLDDCFVEGKLSEIGEQCRDTVRKDHGNIEMVGQKFFDIISATKLTYRHLKRLFVRLPYNQRLIKTFKFCGITIASAESFFDRKMFYFMGIKIFEQNKNGLNILFIPIRYRSFDGYSFPDITNRALRYTDKGLKTSDTGQIGRLFSHVKITGMKTVVPERFIDIDDELHYFDNNPKKLARAKKMIGYGRRYIADDNTTVTDMAVDAAEKLMAELEIDRNEIDLLIFVNQKPDFKEPNDAYIAHGKLNLNKNCTSLDLNMGCAGYVHALMTAHAFLSSGNYKKCLLLAGDLCARMNDQTDRKKAPVFGDAVSATLLEYTQEERNAFFVMGSDGKGWNKIVYPIGGTRLPYTKENIDLCVEDENGNKWSAKQAILKGEDVFNFTMDVAPQLLNDTMKAANWTADDVDLFAIHQANKQIVENIVSKAEIPSAKAPADVFSKYANNSTNSVATVLCDQTKPLKNVVLCAFGVGLSWGGAALDLSGMYNGGISTYIPPKNKPTREQQLQHWIKYFKGEEE